MVFARYLGVGAVATLFHYLTTILLVELGGVASGWAAFTGAVVGAVAAYGLNRKVTFSATTRGLVPGLWRFGAVALASAVANGVMVAAGTAIGIHYMIAQALATLLIVPLSFVINKRWTFQ